MPRRWRKLETMRADAYFALAFSNLIAFFIILDTAGVLHSHRITDIRTSTEAAEALRLLAGELTFLLFRLGIRHYRNGFARYSGSGLIGRLCACGSLETADRTGAQTSSTGNSGVE